MDWCYLKKGKEVNFMWTKMSSEFFSMKNEQNKQTMMCIMRNRMLIMRCFNFMWINCQFWVVWAEWMNNDRGVFRREERGHYKRQSLMYIQKTSPWSSFLAISLHLAIPKFYFRFQPLKDSMSFRSLSVTVA